MRAIETLLKANVQPREAMAVLSMVRDIGIGQQGVELVSIMKNLWIHTDNAFVTWRADLTAVQRRPQAVLGCVQAVLAAGAAHRMYEVVEAPLIGYRRERDGALGAVLARLFAEQAVLDAFGFVGSAMLPGAARSSTVETLLALYDREDHVVEKAVSDLGAELKATEPVEDVIPDGFMMHYPAVRILGRRFEDVHDGELLDRRARPLPVSVRIELHSDIWFPWVFGSAHPEADHKRMFDNRELCARHTPRLNAFLAAVGEATRAAGGTFGIDPDATGFRARDWVTDDGVRLDWEPMQGVFPEASLAAEWY